MMADQTMHGPAAPDHPDTDSRLTSGWTVAAVLMSLAVNLPVAASTIIATDNASNYVGTFIGLDFGTGFQAWTNSSAGSGGSYVGSTGLSSNSFGIYAGGGLGNSFNAYRPFDSALAIGDTFSVDFQPTSIDNSGSVGIQLLVSGNVQASFYFDGGTSNWGWNDGSGGSATNLGFSGAVTFALTRTGTTSYSLGLTQGATTQTLTGDFEASGSPVSAAVDEVGFFSFAQGTNQNFGFDNLEIVAVPEPAGTSLVIAAAALAAIPAVARRRGPRR